MFHNLIQRNSVNLILAALVTVGFASPLAVGATTEWEGDDATTPNDWFDADNWSAGVPDQSDTARWLSDAANGLMVIDGSDAVVGTMDPRSGAPSPLVFTSNTGQKLNVRADLAGGARSHYDFDLLLDTQDLGFTFDVTVDISSAGPGTTSFDGGVNLRNRTFDILASSFSDHTVAFTAPVTGDGSVSFEQSGGGSAALGIQMTAANTYDGPTTVTDGSLLLSGSLANSNVTLGGDGDAQMGVLQGDAGNNGTLFYNIEGAGSDQIVVLSDGELDITNLVLDIEELGAGATEPAYIVADYSAGTLTGSAFADVFDLPSGMGIDYNYQGGNQIAIVVPEPATLALLATGSLVIATRRRK